MGWHPELHPLLQWPSASLSSAESSDSTWSSSGAEVISRAAVAYSILSVKEAIIACLSSSPFEESLMALQFRARKVRAALLKIGLYILIDWFCF